MAERTFGDVHVTREIVRARDAHVATVTIRRPPHNMMSVELARDLADALEALDAERDIRCIVLASEGKSFCAGADLTRRADDVAAANDGAANDGAGEPEPAGNPLYDQAVRLFSTRKPIVAAIQGPAIGAGLGLAMIADFRIASPDARFAANFTKLGFHPGFGLTHTLPRLVGQQAASLMFLTGRRLKAEDALRIGLVDEIADGDELSATAHALAAEIAENAPLAVEATRATLRAGLAQSVREATDAEFAEQRWLMRTEDFREGVKSVTERRPGSFRGK